MTTERCRRASDIDLVTFLNDPGSAVWDEFRQHSTQCADCAAAMAQWNQLDTLLRAFGKTVADAHLTVEQLTQYQRAPQHLSVEERQTIGQHLRHCPDCSEELVSLQLFISAQVRDNTAARKATPTILARLQAVGSRFSAMIPQLFLRPTFAYAVALLVSIPTIRSYLTSSLPSDSTRSPNSQVTTHPQGSSSDIRLPRSGQPDTIARALLTAYQAAYEARDLVSLRHVWDMGPDTASELSVLFAKTHTLALLIDLKDVHIEKQDEQIIATFTQARMWVGEEGVVRYEKPFLCTADIRRDKDSKDWRIWDLAQKELPQEDKG